MQDGHGEWQLVRAVPHVDVHTWPMSVTCSEHGSLANGTDEPAARDPQLDELRAEPDERSMLLEDARPWSVVFGRGRTHAQ